MKNKEAEQYQKTNFSGRKSCFDFPTWPLFEKHWSIEIYLLYFTDLFTQCFTDLLYFTKVNA